MGNNSIRSNLTKSDIISTIKLSLAADFRKEKTFVIVEGISDVIFFKSKISITTQLYESFSGKSGVYEIIDYFDNNRVVGICDRDYDRNNNKRIFYYDYCCLEVMMATNDIAFDSVVSQYYDGDIKPVKIRNSILENLKWLSCFRKLNHINQWSINFDGFSIHKVFDKNRSCIDIKKAESQIISINRNFRETHMDKLKIILDESSNLISYIDLLNITNGHDFLQCLHCMCINSHRRKRRKPGVDTISSSLMCAYRLDDLKNTNLYSELVIYKDQYGYSFLAS